jgi:hypothetical protein
MKTLFIILTVSLSIALTSCSDQFATAPDMESNTDVYAKRDITVRSTSIDESSTVDSEYPQYGNVVVYFKSNKDEYNGSTCELENGSCFTFSNGTLIPPSYITWGEEVTLTMQADLDPGTGELIYTFGPSGCQFLEPATLILDYSILGSENVTLYYLDDDNNRVEHLPDNVDLFNKQVHLYVNHFSRYALAYSD